MRHPLEPMCKARAIHYNLSWLMTKLKSFRIAVEQSLQVVDTFNAVLEVESEGTLGIHRFHHLISLPYPPGFPHRKKLLA